jgi:AraC family transcriptional regulator of adaptative response/methylated-DNA-[protein]-cysteine methyltransferase
MEKVLPTQAEMERAAYGRDASYDGIFYVCVRTTGIFCRPSCTARKPNKKNVVYHATVRDCLLDGFRPCKRCRPLAVGGDGAEWLAPLLAAVEREPTRRFTDADLTAMGISPHRARRYFSRNFDMTFQAYHRARRMGLALASLRGGEDCAAVAYDHSFESLSGFRDAFKRTFGEPPGRSSALQCIHTTRIETPIGPMVAAATEVGVCLLEFADRRALQRETEFLRRRLGAAFLPGRNEHLDRLRDELRAYFDGMLHSFTVPLLTPGTLFQQTVWENLRWIPSGQTLSYARLAVQIGRPGAQRAVGRANGDNRMAIIIPCHRVVRNDGTLCGYGGGLWRKKYLLDLERRACERISAEVRRPASLVG